MQNLESKNIVLGLTGGIAAYKSAELCRELKRLGANVRVVMTQGAQEFITPLTMQALSGNVVHTSLLDTEAEAGMGHIELAKWPDLIIIAPATANFIAQYAQGLANDLLTTLLLASTAPVVIAPAMNQSMWLNPITQRNISVLTNHLEKLSIIGPAEGEQACGDVGPGRMLEASDIAQKVSQFFAVSERLLDGKRVVITAGPTREAIDPVRYISNYSSGKMGYALAASCIAQGADVTLISGPTVIQTPKGVVRKDVLSANDMYDSTMAEIESGCDLFIACAAVADYRPSTVANQKIKKEGAESNEMQITLQQNPDIVASVAMHKKRPFRVGFAAETNDLIHYAQGKLVRKKLDMIIANDVSKEGQGFNSEQNEVYIISKDGQQKLDRESKAVLSEKIIAEVAKYYTLNT